MNNDVNNQNGMAPLEPIPNAMPTGSAPMQPIQPMTDPVAPIQPVNNPQVEPAPMPAMQPMQEAPVAPMMNPQIQQMPVDAPSVPNMESQMSASPVGPAPMPNTPPTAPKAKKKVPVALIAVIAVILAVLGVGGYFLLSSNNPVKVYQGMIKQGISDLYSGLNQKEDKVKSRVDLDFNIEMDESLTSGDKDVETLLDLINDLKLGMEAQEDSSKKQMVIKVDAKYQDKNILDGNFYIDADKEKMHIFVKQIFDKYIEINSEDIPDLEEVFELLRDSYKETKISDTEKYIANAIAGIITDDVVKKEDGKFVLTITAEKLMERIGQAIKELKNNKDFLGCFEEDYREELKETLDILAESLENAAEYMLSENIVVTIEKAGLGNKVKRATIKYSELEVTIDEITDGYEFKVMAQSMTLLSGKTTEKDNKGSIELKVDLADMILFEIKMTTITEYGKEIDKVDTSKVISLMDLTEKDTQKIIENLAESDLYKFIEIVEDMFAGYNELPDNEDIDWNYPDYRCASAYACSNCEYGICDCSWDDEYGKTETIYCDDPAWEY